MRLLTLLFAVVFSCAAQAAAGEESLQGALQRGAAAYPSQYSFADLYRLTLASPAAPGFSIVPAGEPPIRVAASQAPAQFSISEVREPRLGLLLLSGIALAVWVARRRLGYSF
jgi:hypothetical protein